MKLVDLVLLVLVIAFCSLLAEELSIVDADDMQETIYLASKNEQAQSLIKEYIQKNPAPHKYQWRSITEEVNKIVVMKISQDLTPEASAVSPSNNSTITIDSGDFSGAVWVWAVIAGLGVFIFGMWWTFLRPAK